MVPRPQISQTRDIIKLKVYKVYKVYKVNIRYSKNQTFNFMNSQTL